MDAVVVIAIMLIYILITELTVKPSNNDTPAVDDNGNIVKDVIPPTLVVKSNDSFHEEADAFSTIIKHLGFPKKGGF